MKSRLKSCFLAFSILINRLEKLPKLQACPVMVSSAHQKAPPQASVQGVAAVAASEAMVLSNSLGVFWVASYACPLFRHRDLFSFWPGPLGASALCLALRPPYVPLPVDLGLGYHPVEDLD